MKVNIFCILFIFFNTLSFCQQNEYNCNTHFKVVKSTGNYKSYKSQEVEKDLKFARFIDTNLSKQNFKLTDFVDSLNRYDRVFLAKDYYYYEGSYGVEHFTLFYNYVVKHNQVIAFKLVVQGDDIEYVNHHGINLKKYFRFNEQEQVYYLIKNAENRNTTSSFDTKDISSTIKFYTSPFSGLLYGCRGGYGDLILNNRCHFNKIKDSLNTTQLIYIMKGLNPASRLTAVEYYLKYKSKFSLEDSYLLSKEAENVFKSYENNEILILKGEELNYASPKTVLNEMIKKECN